MSLFGVELNAQINKLLLEAKLQMSKHKFLPNLRTLYRSFASFDQEVQGKINITNFEKVSLVFYSRL